MIELDTALIAKARLLITGANVHRLKMHIFLYQESVALHNSGHSRHTIYHRHYEDLLRDYVHSAWPARVLMEETRRLTAQALEHCQRGKELGRQIDYIAQK